MKFKGVECPVCSVEFADKDDVVVCPDCGTPHHRSCYAQNGQCANLLLHGTDGIAGANGANDEQDVVVVQADSHNDIPNNGDSDFEERRIFGVSKAELAAFMQLEPNGLAYKIKLEQIKLFNFNLLAGFLAPFYQFYKGMRLFGLMVLIPVFYLNIVPMLYPGGGEAFVARYWGSMERYNNVSSFVVSALMVSLWLFNDYVYLRHCAYRIKKLRLCLPSEHQSGAEYYSFLRDKGAPNVLRGLIEAIAAFFLLLIAAQFLLTS